MTSLNNVTGRAVARITVDTTVISTSGGNSIYVGGSYVRDADGWSVYRHELKFVSELDYDAALVAISTTRRLTFQSGIDLAGSISWSPAQTQVLVSYDAEADSAGSSGAGFKVVITTSDLLYTGAIWWRTRAWRGSPASIVEQIGTSLGLTPSVAPTPTTSALTLLQCYEPCLDFLRRIINNYLTGSNASDVTLAAHADNLLVGAAGWEQWPRYQLNYPGPGAEGLQHADHERDLRFPGCRAVTGVQYNPTTGVTKSVSVNPQTSLTRLGSLNPPGDPKAIFTYARHTLPVNVSSFWSRAYAEANLNQLGASVTVTGPDYLLPGALLTLNTALINDPFAGIYQVSQVYTELSGGEAKTRLTLRRGNFNAATITAPGTPPEPEKGTASTTAPGTVSKTVQTG
jgi:hypothetical protein